MEKKQMIEIDGKKYVDIDVVYNIIEHMTKLLNDTSDVQKILKEFEISPSEN